MLDYKIKLYIKGIYDLEFDETQISLGTQTKETLDRSYDTSSLEILLTDIEWEFQPYTEAILYIYTTDENGKPTNALYHHLMIEGDEITDQYIGNKTKYNHRITLIEATKILETELMPNITFTQPVKNETLAMEYALEVDKADAKLELAVSGLGFNGAAQALLTIGAAALGAVGGVTAVLVATKLGAELGSMAGPWGALIGAAVGLVIGSVISIVSTLVNQDARLLRDFINALDIKHNIPDKVSAVLVPGKPIPDVSVTVNVDGFLDTVNRYFGEGGVWQAIGMLLSVYNTIQTIIKLFATLFDGDETISFKMKPAGILLTNMGNGQCWTLGTATKVTKESDAKFLGFTVGKATWYEIQEVPKVPEDLTDGYYALLYTFYMQDLWVRDFENWPFDMHWNDMKLNEEFEVEGAKVTLGQFINGSAMISYENLYYESELANLVNGVIEAEYETQPIYMDEFLERLENQMNCRDYIPEIKLTPEWEEGYKYDIITGEELVSPTSYKSKRRYFTRPTKSIGINALFSDTTKYSERNVYDKSKLKADVDILFIDQNENFLSLYQASVEMKHSNSNFELNLITSVPPGAAGYKANITLSPVKLYDKEGNDVTELDLYNVDMFNTSFKEENFRPSKYKFSDKAKSLAHIVCPEFTFEGKTLWEICLEIGEIFHGIPILREGNIIDFHIIDDNEKKTINFSKESETKVVNMTNYATKLYTPELKGIIQDDIAAEEGSFCTYPGPGAWIKARCSNYDETVINRENAAIVIEGETGIYKLKEVWCKCPIFNAKNEQIAVKEYNITNYVLEKTLYDTLSEELNISFGAGNSTSEKGTFAYYVQGENAIHNLAQLPDNASILGWKQTHLTIQFLLKKQFNLSFNKLDETHSSNNIFDYEFRVKYVPKHSRLNIARQTNLAGIGNQITNNFNQTSNLVSASAFSKLSENTLQRLGNPEIITSYTTTTLKDNINVGDCLELNGKNYYVNTKFTTFNNSDKTVQLSLTKDNYKQNDRVAVSREHRQYNIDSRNQVRKTLSKPFTLIVSNEPIQIADDSSYIRHYSSKNKHLIARSIKQTLNRNSYQTFSRLTNAFVSVKDKNNYKLKYNKIVEGKVATDVLNKVIPVIGECLGNTLTFQWDMYDNFSAGRKIKSSLANTLAWLENRETEYTSTAPVSSGKDQTKYERTTVKIKEGEYGVKIQDDCRYCDDLGGTPRVYTSFFSIGKNTSLGDNYSIIGPDTGYTKASITESVAENELALDFIADKDSREKLSFQVTVSAQTFDKDIDIYSLMKVNPLVSELKYESAKWYGYTKYNQPDDSGIYEPYAYYELTNTINGPLENKGDVYVRQYLKNETGYDFIGYVLVAKYEDSKPEVLLNIRKPLGKKQTTNVYYTVFDDEVSLSDTTFLEYVDTDYLDFDKYIPSVYLYNNKLYLDLNDLEAKTGLTRDKVNLALVTKHTTNGRGIPDGYHGRKYRKYKKTQSLYHTANVYCGNPEVKYDKAGNMIKITPFRFSKIYIGTDGQLLCDDKSLKQTINFYQYLMEKHMSKQDFGRGRRTDLYLDYGFRAIELKTKRKSDFKKSLRVNYKNRIPESITTI